MALGKVYSFGPTFRAEKSKTRRHLTEFWMVEPEVAYAHARRHHGNGRGTHQLPREAMPGAAARRPADDWSRYLQTGEDRSPRFRASRYDEAVKMLQEGHAKGALENKVRVGRRSRLAG